MSTQMEILRKMIGGLTPTERKEFFELLSGERQEEESFSSSTEEISAQTDEELEYQIGEFLIQFGCSCNLDGYSYLKYAILLTYHDGSYSKKMVKKLYPAVAAKFNTMPAKVERGIRHAIEVTFSHANPADVKKYFGNSIDSEKNKPTNGEFIARIVQILHSW